MLDFEIIAKKSLQPPGFYNSRFSILPALLFVARMAVLVGYNNAKFGMNEMPMTT